MTSPSQHIPNDIRAIRPTWVDNAGIIRGEAIMRRVFEQDSERGFYVVRGVQGLQSTQDAIAPGSGLRPAGGVWLVPEWDTLRTLPFSPGLAAMMGHFVTDDSDRWSLCPRSCLWRAQQTLHAVGYELTAAIESEFYLLRRTDDGFEPLDRTHYASALGLNSAWHLLDLVADALEVQNVPVRTLMAESGPGQFEVVVEHADAMTAADRFITVRETVHAIANEHGLMASFLPKVFLNEGGNGCHLHLGLTRGGDNALADGDTLSSVGRQILAGVLHHLPALAALTTPCPNSYRRLSPGTWSGAFQCWGHDNKEAALRLPATWAGAGPTNIELKTFDATANPYLGIAGVIAACLDGLGGQLDLPEPVDCDPASLPEGIVAPMPKDSGEALAALEIDLPLRAMIGEDLMRAYLAVKRAEWATIESWSHDRCTEELLEVF